MPRLTSIWAKRRVGGGDANVGGEEQLDPEREHPAVNGDDTGVVQGPSRRQGSRPSAGNALARRERRPDVGEVKAGGEVVAVREQNPGAQFIVGFELRVGRGARPASRGERVALVGRFSPISSTCPSRSSVTVSRVGRAGAEVIGKVNRRSDRLCNRA